jgi:hypothetical protein
MEQLINRDPVLLYGNGKSRIIKTTFSELKQCKKSIHIPEIQTDCSEEKIQEIKECYLKNKHFFSSKSLLTIAKVEIVNNIEYCLIDGQHRFHVAMELIEEEINDSLLLSVITVNSEDEMKQLFTEINADSSKCIYKNLTIFDKENYALLKQVLKLKIPNALEKSNIKSNVYSISQFVSMLIDKNLIERLREKHNKNYDIKELYKYLIIKENEYFNDCEYLEQLHNNKPFKQDEKEQIANKRIMFLKKNNFVDWLIDENIEPEHFFNLRQVITKKLRFEVWDEYYKKQNQGRCLVIGCKNILEKEKEYNWDCGHIKSHYNKGKTEKDNLKPICVSCNRKMNYKNWDDYEDELKRNIIIKEFFSKKDKIKCKSGKKNCDNKITIETFTPIEDGDKLKPFCKDCVDKKIEFT